MSALPSIAPRLVVHAADVEDLLVELAEEHAALQQELDALARQLDAAMTGLHDSAGGLRCDEALVRTVTERVGAQCRSHLEDALAELAAVVTAGEHAAAERVASAEAETAELLAVVRLEAADRIVAQAEPVAPASDAGDGDDVSDAGRWTEDGSSGVRPTAHSREEGATARATDVGRMPPAGWDWDDHEVATARFRAFWSEHDEVASVREAITAPILAIAPMALALLVIVLLLVLVV